MSERQLDSNHALTKSNVIAFIAYGEANTRQAIFSICSILLFLKKRPPNFSLVVYSNQPSQFEFLEKFIQISIRCLIDEEVRLAIQPENYFPKLKIVLMNEMLERDGIENLILIDSDTFFQKHPEMLFQEIKHGKLIMHLFEWKFAIGRKHNPILCPADGSIVLESGRVMKWDDNSEMYNVGVIGIGFKGKNLIRDSLDFLVKYFVIYPSWHVEQLCVSLVFQQHGDIHFAKKQIFHYWHSKSIFTKLTGNFFSLIDSGRYQEALNEARGLIPRMVFEMQTRLFLAQSKVWFRDLPGVYGLYKIAIKPFFKK